MNREGNVYPHNPNCAYCNDRRLALSTAELASLPQMTLTNRLGFVRNSFGGNIVTDGTGNANRFEPMCLIEW